MKKYIAACIVMFSVLAPLYSVQGTPATSVPVKFSFDTETAVHVEFGFTGNAVSSMTSSVVQVSSLDLVETYTDSRLYTLSKELFAYWRILAASDYSLTITHPGYLDDMASSDPADIIPFTLTCGTEVIPANTATEIFSHSAHIEPSIQYKPITVNTSSASINASTYIATVTLTLTTT